MVVDTVALEKGLRAEFNRAMDAMLGDTGPGAAVKALITEAPSTSASEKYGWLGDVPTVKEWIGDKNFGSLADYDYTIRNKDFYTGIDIDRNEIEDDQMGIVLPRVQMLVLAIAAYKLEMVETLILAGTSGLAYDAAAFFANRAAPNDNLLAGSGADTIAHIKTDIAAARAAMMRFTSDQGRVMRLQIDTIGCPPEIEGMMLEVVTSTTAADANAAGVNNPIRGWIKNVIPFPGTSDLTDWYGFATGYPIKPFIFQNRKNPVPVLDEGQVKTNRKLKYSAEMRCNVGYGFYQMGLKMVNS